MLFSIYEHNEFGLSPTGAAFGDKKSTNIDLNIDQN
jgi:hypothetical protein